MLIVWILQIFTFLLFLIRMVLFKYPWQKFLQVFASLLASCLRVNSFFLGLDIADSFKWVFFATSYFIEKGILEDGVASPESRIRLFGCEGDRVEGCVFILFRLNLTLFWRTSSLSKDYFFSILMMSSILYNRVKY